MPSLCVRVLFQFLFLVFVLVLVFIFVTSVVTRKPQKNIIARNLGSFAVPKDSFMREPIAQPDVAAAKYDIKPNLVSMVQQDQFRGFASEDAGMHLQKKI